MNNFHLMIGSRIAIDPNNRTQNQ